MICAVLMTNTPEVNSGDSTRIGPSYEDLLGTSATRLASERYVSLPSGLSTAPQPKRIAVMDAADQRAFEVTGKGVFGSTAYS